MTLDIKVDRTGSFRSDIGTLEKQKAQDALKSIQTYLTQQGRDTGILTLFNRNNQREDLRLEQKSRFQLFFRSTQRLDDTKTAMMTLLRRAGLSQAEAQLDAYLKGKPEGKQNRIDSSEMLKILNLHLGSVGGTDKGGGMGGLETPPSSNPALDAPAARPGIDPFDMMEGDVGDDMDGRERLASMDLWQLKSDEPLVLPAAVDTAQVRGASLDELLENAGVVEGRELGKGAFGAVYEASMPGQGESLVMKRFFKNGEPATESLSTERTNYSEAVAAYLTSNKDKDYASEVNVAQPRFFIVKKAGEDEYRMVKPLELRALLKEEHSVKWECAGLLMPKAPGNEVFKCLDRKADQWNLTDENKKQIIKSTLQSVMKLNERGFTHHDLKLENVLFDAKSGKTTVIDTGMMHKRSRNKSREDADQSPFIQKRGGTSMYMHPRALYGLPHGSETDLYATAVMALELEHGNLGLDLTKLMRDTTLRGGQPIQPSTLLHAVIYADRGGKRPRPGHERVYQALQDPKSLTSLAMACMEQASKPVNDWADRQKAQAFYAELLWHPSLN